MTHILASIVARRSDISNIYNEAIAASDGNRASAGFVDAISITTALRDYDIAVRWAAPHAFSELMVTSYLDWETFNALFGDASLLLVVRIEASAVAHHGAGGVTPNTMATLFTIANIVARVGSHVPMFVLMHIETENPMGSILFEQASGRSGILENTVDRYRTTVNGAWDVARLVGFDRLVREIEVSDAVATLILPIHRVIDNADRRMELIGGREARQKLAALENSLLIGRGWVILPTSYRILVYGLASDELVADVIKSIDTVRFSTTMRVLHDAVCLGENCVIGNVGRSNNPVVVWVWPEEGPPDASRVAALLTTGSFLDNNEYLYAEVSGEAIRVGNTYLPTYNLTTIGRALVLQLSAFAGNRIRFNCSRYPRKEVPITAIVVDGLLTVRSVEYADGFVHVAQNTYTVDRDCLYDFVAARLQQLVTYRGVHALNRLSPGYSNVAARSSGFIYLPRDIASMVRHFEDDMLSYLSKTVLLDENGRSLRGGFTVYVVGPEVNRFLVVPREKAGDVARALSLRCYRDTTNLQHGVRRVEFVNVYRCYQPFQVDVFPPDRTYIGFSMRRGVVTLSERLPRILVLDEDLINGLVNGLSAGGFTVLVEPMSQLAIRIVAYRVEDDGSVVVPYITG